MGTSALRRSRLWEYVIALQLLILLFPCVTRPQDFPDAVILTLRVQTGIHLDTLLERHIDSGLVAARLTLDTLSSIHAFPDYSPNQVELATVAPWSQAWRRGEILTGEPFIDSLAIEFGLVRVDTPHYNEWYDLNFDGPKQMIRLSQVYGNHPDVIGAEPAWVGGDGDRIEYLEKDSAQYFVFSQGWGDCPSGCIYRYNWYVSVTCEDTGRTGQLVGQVFLDDPEPYLFPFNIPPAFSMTMFSSADSIIDSINAAADWWARRHAIEGAWRFFACSSPWSYWDHNSRWGVLRDDIRTKGPQLLQALNEALNDLDEDVRASAQRGIDTLTVLSAPDAKSVPTVLTLEQNFPNPFNPRTVIRYSLPVMSHVTLKVYNVLGQEVAALVDEVRNAGTYHVEFRGENLSSGMYFYRMQAGDYVETKKLILLK